MGFGFDPVVSSAGLDGKPTSGIVAVDELAEAGRLRGGFRLID